MLEDVRDVQGCSGCPGMFRDARGCPGMLGMLRMLWDVQGCSGVLGDAPGCSGMLGMLWDVQGMPVMFGAVQGCSRLFRDAGDARMTLPEVGLGARCRRIGVRGSRRSISAACGVRAPGAPRGAVSPKPGGHVPLSPPQEGSGDPKICAEGCGVSRSERRAAVGTRDVFAATPGPGAAPRKTRRNANLFLSGKLRSMETGLGSQEASLATVGFLCQSSETVNTKYGRVRG